MSLRKVLGRILLACMLQMGALAGVKMTPEEIEKVMNIMHRTKVVHILKQDDEL
ncbi:MAG TPA: hypothetical protein VGQ36_00980 [Thermoanaerobaculia bacterium]|jgi:hypothetical protein|nr:hypothetical protein [Thermoanaerobaculia bacterium]